MTRIKIYQKLKLNIEIYDLRKEIRLCTKKANNVKK